MEAKTLDDAVTALLASLDGKRRAELALLVLNSRVELAHNWMREVIEMFDLTNPAQALIADIEQRFPDESALKLIESDSDQPIFEAKILLREAQRRLLKKGLDGRSS